MTKEIFEIGLVEVIECRDKRSFMKLICKDSEDKEVKIQIPRHKDFIKMVGEKVTINRFK
jgi:hypothetical protein